MHILLLTGFSASGKSTIARAISQNYDLPLVDIHSLVHPKAISEGYARARDWASSVGLEAALSFLRNATFNLVRDLRNPKGLIIDEVLDSETFRLMGERFPEDTIRIIRIMARDEKREKFIKQRLNTDSNEAAQRELASLDNLKLNLGIEKVMAAAHYVVANDAELPVVIERVSAVVRREVFGERSSKEREV